MVGKKIVFILNISSELEFDMVDFFSREDYLIVKVSLEESFDENIFLL